MNKQIDSNLTEENQTSTIEKLQKEITRLEKDIAKSEKECARLEKKSTKFGDENTILEPEYKSLTDDSSIQDEKNVMLHEVVNLIKELESNEDSLLQSEPEKQRYEDSMSFDKKKWVQHILTDPERIYRITSYCKDVFEWICEESKKIIAKRDDAPLFEEDLENPGNLSLLSKDEAVLLALKRKSLDMNQGSLAVFLPIDKTTVSRYLKFMNTVLCEFLPTAEKITQRIMNAKTIQEFEKIFPNSELVVDGLRVRTIRSNNKEDRHLRYFERKLGALSVIFVSNTSGLICYTSKVFDCSMNGNGMLRNYPIDLGRWTESLHIDNGHTVTVYADKGCRGADKYLPGANLIIPPKKPRNGELALEQQARDKEISRKRVAAEYSIKGIQSSSILKGIYDSTNEDFENELMATTGLANLHKLWDPDKKCLVIDF